MNMEAKKVKYNSPAMTLALGIILIAVGVLLAVGDAVTTVSVFICIFCLLLALEGIKDFVKLREEGEPYRAVRQLVYYIIFAAALFIFARLFVTVINIVLAVLSFALFVLHSAILFHMFKNGISGKPRTAASAVISLFFCLALIFYPYEDKLAFTMFVTGVYLICMGGTLVGDFIAGVLGSDLDPERTRRRIHFAMPNIITATMTKRLIDACGSYLAEHPDDTEYTEEKEDADVSKVNFEIMVHTSRRKGKFFGHVDVAIGDTVYTYGNYDTSTHKLGGFIAKGTFVTMPKKPYIDICLTKQQKYIVSYGCVLSETQLAAARERIEEILEDTVPINVAPEKLKGKKSNGITVYTRIGGSCYRVKKGPFKTYFAIASNCVKLADSIAGRAGLDRISGGNLTTPGSYLCMLDNMFYRKGTYVVKRTVYLKPEK